MFTLNIPFESPEMRMSYLSHLECSRCHASADPDALLNSCPICSKPLLARYDLAAASAAVNHLETADRPHSMWRFHELLPVRKKSCRLSLGEGWTPLLHTKNLGEKLGHASLYIKDEGANPTGSFKARGLGVAVSCALERGALALSIPSAGNAASAMSAYASLAGLEAHVFMPKDVPDVFVTECTVLGANVTLVDGLITDAAREAAEHPDAGNRFNVSTLKEPYRIEGKKTMGYEIAEQFGWTLPDVLIYPTGGGTGLIGMWKAFDEMEEMGWIDGRRPRMVSVQAVGCAPIVKAFEEGASSAEPWQNASTIAAGMRVPSAAGDFLILDALRESNGTALAVDDEAMLNMASQIGRTEGVFASPEGAATAVAFEMLKGQGWIEPDDKVVLFNTGTGLKYFQLWSD